VILYGVQVPVAVRLVANCYIPFIFTIDRPWRAAGLLLSALGAGDIGHR